MSKKNNSITNLRQTTRKSKSKAVEIVADSANDEEIEVELSLPKKKKLLNYPMHSFKNWNLLEECKR